MVVEIGTYHQGFLGELYLDLYARPSKRVANSMYTIRGRCEDLNGAIQHPIVRVDEWSDEQGVIVSHLPFGGSDIASVIESNMVRKC